MLNLACGGRFHKDWINIDFHPDSTDVKSVNLLGGLPFEGDSLDVAYSSHFIEHLSQEDGKKVVDETYRVLKKGGIIRIVVPCLENICREYISVINELSKNVDDHLLKKHKYITIELIDQLTRDISGGEMQKLFNRTFEEKDKYLADYILFRTGDNVLQNIENTEGKAKITLARVKNKILYVYLNLVQLLIPVNIRKLVFNQVSIGEKHKWMYDKYSMYELLMDAGFKNITAVAYDDSQIDGFNDYCLDSKNDGSPYKGSGSLYVEAIK